MSELVYSLRSLFYKKHLEKWLITIFTGFALWFVLYIYKAYNIQQDLSLSGHTLLARSIVFGAFTSLTFFINEFFLVQFFISNIFNKPKYFLWTIWEIVSGATVTFLLFNYFWNWTELYADSYFLLLFEYTCVVVFPIILARKLSSNANADHAKNELLHIYSENGKNKLSIKPDALYYIKSEDNYIRIFYMSNGGVKGELIRNSLKNIEQHFQYLYLVRIHKGYMINPQQIVKVADKPRLQVDLGNDITLPVSQKYRNDLLKAIS